jgi:adenylate cyclase
MPSSDISGNCPRRWVGSGGDQHWIGLAAPGRGRGKPPLMAVRLMGTRGRVYLIAAGVVVLALAVFLWAPEFLKTVEIRLYDLHFKLRGVERPGDGVVIAAIDEKSLAALGRWPWPRSLMGELIRVLSAGGAKVIAVDILLSEPEVSGELRAATQLSERLRTLGAPGVGAAGSAVQRELEDLMRRADHDRQLADAIRESGRVILPMVFEVGPDRSGPPLEPSGAPYKSALQSFRHYDERGLYPPPAAKEATPPLPALVEAAQALGHVTMLADQDGTTRWEAVVFEDRGRYYPSLAVQAVRVALGVEPKELTLDFGRTLTIGAVAVPLDPRDRLLINYAGPGGTFRYLSAVDLLSGKVSPETVRDRIVFIGATAAGTYDLRVTPTSPIMPGVEKHANVAANVLSGRFLRRPDWVELVEVSGILFFPIALAWLLPRLRPVVSLGAVLAVWGLLFAAVHLAFRGGLWLPVVYPTLALGLTFVGITVYRLLTEERQRLWTKRAFQRFVSPEVVERLMENPAALQFGGEVRPLTVLFTDIRDFTGFTERHQPQEVVQMLREYLTRMVDQVLAQQGTLDKFIGDAVMAIFGAPVPLPDHAERACRAAVGMIRELETLQARWAAEGREPFRMGIGINTGEMVVGNLGSEQLFDYTVVGDGVNLAARLESLNKEYKTTTPIIISESTYLAAKDVLDVVRLGEVTVKGKSRPVVIYELRGLRDAGEQALVPASLTTEPERA